MLKVDNIIPLWRAAPSLFHFISSKKCTLVVTSNVQAYGFVADFGSAARSFTMSSPSKRREMDVMKL